MTDIAPEKRKTKIRNYSFQSSKRLPPEKMTEVNGTRIPSMPGSCYHAIICALAESKDQFCPWDRIIERTEKYMRQYGGQEAWDKFKHKNKVKSFEQRIKDNTHTLTRSGRDCYGYRLHERGMCIYYFKDGAILLTGGLFVQSDGDGQYNVQFTDGRRLQVRYRGTTMTSKEYKRFLEAGWIDKDGEVINPEQIKEFRSKKISKTTSHTATVTVVLRECFDQNTAVRLEAMGFVVKDAQESDDPPKLVGTLPADRMNDLMHDKDVYHVEVVD